MQERQELICTRCFKVIGSCNCVESEKFIRYSDPEKVKKSGIVTEK